MREKTMEIKFLLDANMPHSSTEIVRKSGWNAVNVRDIGMRNAEDKEIVKYAFDNNYVIITRDRGFGNIFHYPKGTHRGIVILKLPSRFTAEEINMILAEFLKSIDKKKITKLITIIELGRYRIRKD